MTPFGAQFRLAHGEVLKRVIPVTYRRGPVGSGGAQLFVTDARLIYVAQTRNLFSQDLLVQDIQIQDVNGVNLDIRRGLKSFGAGMLILLTLGALVSFFAKDYIPFIVEGVIAGIIAVVGMRRAGIFLTVSARQTGAGALVMGVGNYTERGGLIFLLKLWLTWPVAWLLPLLGVMDAADVFNNAPSRQAVALFHELGALILELQGKGVLSDVEWTPSAPAVQR